MTVRSEDVIKKIFKSSLETDILIDMVQVFMQGLTAKPELALDVAEFLKATCECWPFEIAVEFLSEAEKETVRGLLEKLERGEGVGIAAILNKLYQKFKVQKELSAIGC